MQLLFPWDFLDYCSGFSWLAVGSRARSAGRLLWREARATLAHIWPLPVSSKKAPFSPPISQDSATPLSYAGSTSKKRCLRKENAACKWGRKKEKCKNALQTLRSRKEEGDEAQQAPEQRFSHSPWRTTSIAHIHTTAQRWPHTTPGRCVMEESSSVEDAHWGRFS